MSVRPRIAACAAFFAVLALLIVANLDALRAWGLLWVSGGHEYGLVIIAVTGWFLWQCRARLAAADWRYDWRGIVALGLLAAGTGLAYLVDVRIAQLILFVVAIGALTWAVFGAAVLRIVLYPLGLLFLALPLWNYLRPLLQYITVQATVLGLKLTGVPVFADNTYIHTPRGAFLVLAECSGTQFFQAGLIIGAFYAYLNLSRPLNRVLAIGAFLAMSLLGNWIRVYALVFLGKLTELQHFLVGWGLFAVLMAVVFWLGSRLQRREEKLRRLAPDAGTRAQQSVPASFSTGGVIGVAALAALLVLAGPVGARRLMTGDMNTNAGTALAPIAVQEPWLGPFPPGNDWQPSFQHAGSHVSAAYRIAEGIEPAEVTVYQAYYGRQKQGVEVINELNKVYDPVHWRPRGGYAGTDYRDLLVPGGPALRLIETRLEDVRTGAQRLVWHWYRIGGQDVVRPWRAKVAQAKGLLGGRPDAMVVVVSTPVENLAVARTLLSDFVVANLPALSGQSSRQVRHEP